MIHDAFVEVTCDGSLCWCSELINLEWKYTDYTGNNGYYDSNENDIEDKLRDLGWIVEGGKHFCCQDCYDNQEP